MACGRVLADLRGLGGVPPVLALPLRALLMGPVRRAGRGGLHRVYFCLVAVTIFARETTRSSVCARVSGHSTTGRPAATSALHRSCVAWKRVMFRGLGLCAGAAQPSPCITISLPLAFAALSAAEYCDHAPHRHARGMAWRARMFRWDTSGVPLRR